MVHLSDSGGLAEGDFDYEPDSFLLTVEKNGKTLSNTDFLKYFEKKKPVFIGGQCREIV